MNHRKFCRLPPGLFVGRQSTEGHVRAEAAVEHSPTFKKPPLR